MAKPPKVKQLKSITDLAIDGLNANRGTTRGRKMLLDSLTRYGAGRSILVDRNGTIIAGNKSAEAAKDREIIVVPSDGKKLVVVQRTDLDINSKTGRALAIADNRVGEIGLDWDPNVLKGLGDIDLALFFTEGELTKLIGRGEQEAPEPKLDLATELQKKWKTESGQLWEMGRHRLMCGDSREATQVERLMGGHRVSLVFTDPPYGVDYVGGANKSKRKKLVGDEDAALYRTVLTATLPYMQATAPLYLWFAGTKGRAVYDAVESAGFAVRAMIIWNKLDAHYGNFMAQYMQKHEPCLYCVRESPVWNGPTNEVTVWDVKQPSINANHPTEKPIALATRAITNSSKRGDLVGDWFSGSGTTPCAAENTERRCFAMELEPGYVAVTLERLSEMGLKPKLVK